MLDDEDEWAVQCAGHTLKAMPKRMLIKVIPELLQRQEAREDSTFLVKSRSTYGRAVAVDVLGGLPTPFLLEIVPHLLSRLRDSAVSVRQCAVDSTSCPYM